MEDFTLREINICHAHLNALYAALKGKQACLDTLESLGLLPEEKRKLSDPSDHIRFVEGLLDELWNDNPLEFDGEAYDLTGAAQQVLELVHLMQEELETNAAIAGSLLATKDLREDSAALGKLLSLYACQIKARQTYIEGLVTYGAIFDAPHLESRWREQLETSQTLLERKAKFLEALVTPTVDSGTFTELINETVLLPASFRCQVHDLNQILSLPLDEFTYQAADIDLEEARLWYESGIAADRAGYWRAYGIGPEEVFEWLDFGFVEPRLAGSWRIRGFSSEEADLWTSAGYDPAQAAMYVASGYAHPEMAQTLDKWEH